MRNTRINAGKSRAGMWRRYLVLTMIAGLLVATLLGIKFFLPVGIEISYVQPIPVPISDRLGPIMAEAGADLTISSNPLLGPEPIADPALAEDGLNATGTDLVRSEGYVRYVNVGQCSDVVWNGVTWQADQPYESNEWGYIGPDYNARKPGPFWLFTQIGEQESRNLHSLHLCRAFGKQFGYRFDVPNDTYVVRLRFVEPLRAPGQRAFDVSIEDVVVLDGFDIAAEAGGIGTAIERAYEVTVNDGQLAIDLQGDLSTFDTNAIIQAVAVVAADSVNPPPQLLETPVSSPAVVSDRSPSQPAQNDSTSTTLTSGNYDSSNILNVNAGDCPSVTWSNIDWEADQAYQSGSWGHVGADYNSVDDTVAQAVRAVTDILYDEAGQYLHRCQVYGENFGYQFDVPNGEYKVYLRFADPVHEAGRRWFDVSLEGLRVLDDFDVAAAAGGPNIAIERGFPVQVSDNQLNITFEGIQSGAADSNALLQAIRVAPLELDPGGIAPPRIDTLQEPGPTEEPPAVTPTPEPTQIPTESAPSSYALNVNAGTCGSVNWSGMDWEADQAYQSGGWGHVGADYNSVDDTVAQAVRAVTDILYDEAGQYLHRCQVYGENFGYQFDVPNGEYKVYLRFADPVHEAGRRWFDVSLEGLRVLDDFDVAAAAGGPNIAIERGFTVQVSDNQLNISFEGAQGGAADSNALLQAIRVATTNVDTGAIVPPSPNPTVEPPAPTPTDVIPAASPSPESTQLPPEPASSDGFHVNAGKCHEVTVQGVTWAADQPYQSGGWGHVGPDIVRRSPGLSSVFDSTGTLLSDDLQHLYRCRAFGGNFGYRFDIPEGIYTVSLQFVEPLRDPGQRKFDVIIEGYKVLDDFDIAAEAGGVGYVVERVFEVPVVDGQLAIQFEGSRSTYDNKAIVQAISIELKQENQDTPTPPPDPTEEAIATTTSMPSSTPEPAATTEEATATSSSMPEPTATTEATATSSPTPESTPTAEPTDDPGPQFEFIAEMTTIQDWETAMPPGEGWGGVNDLRFPNDYIIMTNNPLPDPRIPDQVIQFTVNTESPPNRDHNSEMILGNLKQPASKQVYFGGWLMYPEGFGIPSNAWFLASEMFSQNRPIVGSQGPILALTLREVSGGLEPVIVWYPDQPIKRAFFPTESVVIRRNEWTHVEFKYTLDPSSGGVQVRINGQTIRFEDQNGEQPTNLPTMQPGQRFNVMFNLYTNNARPVPTKTYLGPAHFTIGGWHGPAD